MANPATISLFLLISWQMLERSTQEREVLIRDRLVLVLCDQVQEYLNTGTLPPPIKKMPEKYKKVKPGVAGGMDGFKVVIPGDKMKRETDPPAQDMYDGHYDLKARDAAYLCTIMDEYLKTGRQPNLSKTSPDKLDKNNFLKGKKCWKFAWISCDPATYRHSAQRPCGWYQMQNAPEQDCN